MGASADTLAIEGGAPIAAHLTAPRWPPTSKTTAKRLAELYLRGDWSFNRGGQASALCEAFAAHCGARHAVLMANGTVTLMSALAVHGIGQGDEVIVPAFTWLSTAMAVRYVGARIVLVDVEPSTLCLDPARLVSAITSRTRAIIPVHFLGSMADMEAIMTIARRHGLIVVEDCAQAHGGQWDGRSVGTIGQVGSFSFQHNKILSAGEGGICVTDDGRIAERLYRMAHIGYGPGERMGEFRSRPDPDLICHNLRCTEFQALIIRDQLTDLDRRIAGYNRSMARLATLLEGIPGLRIQAPGRLTTRQSCYKWAVVFDTDPLADISATTLLSAIRAEGLPMEPSYGAVPTQLLFNLPATDYAIADGCPVAMGIATGRTLMLSHPWLGADAATIDAVGAVIAKVAGNAAALRQEAA
jgi:dTDP-4-amino-4,6-dideoxygalactose transaminase